ncbi:MAG: DUF4398 domain-containing protein [Mariprofundaceae bacterium]|nr:DUF4398 domain-containing protein [Mariprofundaceae bacterium]
MKFASLLVVLLLLAACATSPPVQEMAAARSAIQTAKELSVGTLKAKKMLKSAEQSLGEAAEAIKEERYEYARQLAVAAKRKAQKAAKLKHKP